MSVCVYLDSSYSLCIELYEENFMESVYIERIIHTYTVIDIFAGTSVYFFPGNNHQKENNRQKD